MPDADGPEGRFLGHGLMGDPLLPARRPADGDDLRQPPAWAALIAVVLWVLVTCVGVAWWLNLPAW